MITKKEWLDDQTYDKLIREYCVRTIYKIWNTYKKPASYYRICENVMPQLLNEVFKDQPSRLPKKSTIERRIRETTEANIWKNGIPPCIRVKAGLFIPNPELFEGEEKQELLKVIEKYRNNP